MSSRAPQGRGDPECPDFTDNLDCFATLAMTKEDLLSVSITENYNSWSTAPTPPHAFFTNSDFSDIAPMPSILQSMSWSPSTRRMFFTLVPTFTTDEVPLIFRSLITVTLSPSFSTVPNASFTMRFSPVFYAALTGAASLLHSCAHSGQT